MKPIERGEILTIANYETIRDHFRARVVAEKRARRISVGPRATAVFENRDTVLLQIQEMLRTERITREAAILHEIETYNHLVPGDSELSCTMMIEIVDKEERESFLARAAGLERTISLEVGDERFAAQFEKERAYEDRTTAVHYLKFSLSPNARAALVDKSETRVVFRIDHHAYEIASVLAPETVAWLRDDLCS